MEKTHKVIALYPIEGSHFFALVPRNAVGSIKFVAVKDGKDAMSPVEMSFEHLIQGRVPDAMSNKEVIHGYMDGIITVLPQTNVDWVVKNLPSSGKPQPDIHKHLFINGRLMYTFPIWLSDSSGDTVSVVSSTDTVRHAYHSGPNKEQWQLGENVSYYTVDYSNLSMSKIRVENSLSGKTSTGDKYSYSSEETDNCTVYDLGIVINSSSNFYELDLATQTVLTMNTPDTFLTDLYDKLGTPQVNNFGNIQALRKWKQMVPPILDLIKKRNIESIADLYLWWKYSYSTSKMDIEAYIKFFKTLYQQSRNPKDVSHYSLTYQLGYNDVLRYNVYLSPFSIGVLESLGLDVNMANTWDLIPFSFVVDWFTCIGDVLHALDVSDLESRVHLRSLLTSRKLVRQYIPTELARFSGDLTLTNYCRQYSNQLPKSVCDVHFNIPSSHLLDASSLVVACKKRR